MIRPLDSSAKKVRSFGNGFVGADERVGALHPHWEVQKSSSKLFDNKHHHEMKLRTPRIGAFLPLLAPEIPTVPSFLCPALSHAPAHRPSPTQAKCFSSFYRRCTQAAARAQTEEPQTAHSSKLDETLLPLSCSGCGALAQTVDSSQAGFYTITRPAIKTYLRHGAKEVTSENAAFSEAVQKADSNILAQLGLGRGANEGRVISLFISLLGAL